MSAVIENIGVAALSQQAAVSDPLDSPVIINALEHPKWDALLANRGGASFFHSSAWARVLCETYGHTPAYFCRFSDGQLRQLLAVMEVSSPLTGRRGVSLPFADFCPPLAADAEDLQVLYESAAAHGRERNWRYLECRGRGGKRLRPDAVPSLAYFGHIVHLNGDEAAMFERMDAAVRRAVRKARRHGLQVEFSKTAGAMEIYYALHCHTRRQHGLPPQSLRFFKNVHRYVIDQNRGFIAVVRRDRKPVAAAVFLQEGRHALYKFGASDIGSQPQRPNNLLMWEAIKHCAENGFVELHLGRTSLANQGLRRFKLGFGAVEERIEYTKHNLRRDVFVTDMDRAVGPLNRLFRRLPMPLLRLAGTGLYRHLS